MKRIAQRSILFAALLLAGCSGIPVCSLDGKAAYVITTYAKVPIASPLEGAAKVCK